MLSLMSPALALGFPQPANVPGVQMTRWTVDQPVGTACFSRSVDHLAFGLSDGTLRLVPLRRFAARMMSAAALHHRSITAIRRDCADDRFVCAGADGRVAFINGDGFGAEIADYGDGSTLCIDVHPAVGRAVAHRTKVEIFDSRGNRLSSWTDHPEPITDLSFSPDGRHLAVAYEGGTTVWSGLGKDATRRDLAVHGVCHSLAWSPDSEHVAASVGHSARCWRAADGHKVIMHGGDRSPKELAWTSDSRYLAGGGNSAVLCWPMRRRTGYEPGWPRALGVAADCPVTRISCHPNHPLVAAGYDDGCVLLADISGGREIVLRHADGESIDALQWSPDGDYLATGTAGGVAAVFDFTAFTRQQGH
ncbi:MAG: hypothetical protein CMM50_13165 [Rhodospirillaceae bacterium]|nr:hypothetical protein [Rhodospirillaceae bacterium]